MGQRLPNFCRKNPTEKSSSGTGKPSRSCLVAACKLVLLSQLALTSACTLSCFYTSAFFYRLPLLEFLLVFWNSLDLMVLCTWTFNIAPLNVSQSFSLTASSAESSRRGEQTLHHQRTGPGWGQSSGGTWQLVNGLVALGGVAAG